MASRGAIAARAQSARQRLSAGMARLAKEKGVTLPPPFPFAVRQPELKSAVELERLADLLDAVSPVVPPSPVPASPVAQLPETPAVEVPQRPPVATSVADVPKRKYTRRVSE